MNKTNGANLRRQILPEGRQILTLDYLAAAKVRGKKLECQTETYPRSDFLDDLLLKTTACKDIRCRSGQKTLNTVDHPQDFNFK
ncbi:hypothetical protein [Xenorhabdus siamensis]|uniref:hypothetical protein n=1 Tax=Xenorhabdus siamensis TaxID=3136254 RepID=UPI0030F3A970